MQVRLKTLGGVWETVGVDRLSGITPENIQAASNLHGSDTCRFILKRDPGALYPELRAFTPCELLHAGRVVWSGRVWETPAKEGADQQISVEGRGWQYHLDDKSYTFPYSRQRMEFKDVRALLHADLPYFTAVGTVGDENGATMIGWQKDALISPYNMVGVRYDLGPEYEDLWARFFVRLYYNAAQADIEIYIRSHNSESPAAPAPYGPGADYSDLLYHTVSTPGRGAEEVLNLTASIPRRYVSVFMRYFGTGGTLGNEEIIHIRAFQLYGAARFNGMTEKSHVRASDLVVDSINQAAPLIQTPAERSTKFSDEVLGNPTVAAYFSHDEQTGAVMPDRGPYGNNMTMTGTPTIIQAAGNPAGSTGLDQTLGIEAANKAMIYNGSQYGSTVLAQAPTERSSMMVVFKATTLPQTGLLAYLGNPAINGFGIFIGQHAGVSSNVFLLRGNLAWVDTGIALTANQWYLITVSFAYVSGNTLHVRLYDTTGARIDLYSSSGVSVNAPTNVFKVGGDTTIDEFTGYIDESALFTAPFNNVSDPDGGEQRLAYSAFVKNDGPVQRTGFWIPEFPMETAQTPREVIDAGNVFHDHLWKVNHEPTLEFRPKAGAAKFEVGSWSGAQFEDASANAAEEIYNEVRVEASDVLGESIVIKRGGLQPNPLFAFRNGTFETGASWWSETNAAVQVATDGTISRSGSNSLRIDVLTAPYTAPTVYTEGFDAKFVNGNMYRITGWMYRTAKANNYSGQMKVINTVGSTAETITKTIPAGGQAFWFKVSIDFQFDIYGTVRLEVMNNNNGTAGAIFHLDDMQLLTLDNSTPSRMGFIRSKTLTVNAALTQAAGEKIADTWLAGRQITPLKGSLTHSSHGGIRELLTGAGVAPAEMLNQTGEKIMFSHRIDPDTGDWGRLGTIATISYDGSIDSASITIDSTRQDFEALLGRYAAVAGTIR